MATPNGMPTMAWFQWGTDAEPGLVTPAVDVGVGTNVVRVSTVVSNLVAGQVYRCQLVVSNALGTVRGHARPFVTAGTIKGWGDNIVSQSGVPTSATNVVSITAGGDQSLALRNDGAVVAWGGNYFGQSTVPSRLGLVESVAGGDYHSLALRESGTVVAWGDNSLGQTNVPPTLSNTVEVVGGAVHSLALRVDGTVAGWGNNRWGQISLPYGLCNVVAVAPARGGSHSLALRNDGRVVAFGASEHGQISVPPGLRDVVAIAAGGGHNLALRQDGTVVAWGLNDHGQTNVPAGLTNIVSVAAGIQHSLAMRHDGTVVAWGWDILGQATVPHGIGNAVAISAGWYHNFALVGSPPLLSVVQPPSPESVYFRQTGLMAHRVRVLNPGPTVVPAVRVVVLGLRSGDVVYNASGTNSSARPYVQYNQPLAPNASIDLTIEYYVPNRTAPEVTIVADWVVPAHQVEPAGTIQALTRSLRMADGSTLIDFQAISNHTYYIQYSPDLTTWKTVFPPVLGRNSIMQWVDNGPPKTESHPSTEPRRFYRLLMVP